MIVQSITVITHKPKFLPTFVYKHLKWIKVEVNFTDDKGKNPGKTIKKPDKPLKTYFKKGEK